MILRSLELRHFLSHENSLINFDLGINLITGKNGSGKSSIIDGIKFALFGDSRGSSVVDLIKRGRPETTVSLEFSIGPDIYRVTRTMALGKNGSVRERDAVLLKNDAEMARSVTGVNSALVDTLGISEELFLNSVFVEQGEIASLVSENKSVRERTFSHILGLNFLQQLSMDIAESVKEARVKSAALDGAGESLEAIRQRISQGNEDLSSLKREYEGTSIRARRKEGELATITDEEKGLQQQIATLVSAAERVSKIRAQMDGLKGQEAKTAADLARIGKNISVKEESIDRKLLASAPFLNKYYDLTGRKESQKLLLQSVQEQVQQAEGMKRDLDALKSAHLDFTKEEKNLAALETEKSSLEQQERDYAVLESRLDQDNAKLRGLDSELSKIAKAVSKEFSGSISEEALSVRRQELESGKSEKDSKISEIKAGIGQLNSRRNEIKQKIRELEGNKECPLCHQSLTQDHMRQVLSEYSGEDLEIQKSILEMVSKKERLDSEREQILSSIHYLSSQDVMRYFSLKTEISSLNSQISEIEERKQATVNGHKRFVRLIGDIALAKENIQKLKNPERQYTAIEEAMKKIDLQSLKNRSAAISDELSSLERQMAELIDRLGFQPDPTVSERLNASIQAEGELNGLLVDKKSLEVSLSAMHQSFSELDREKKDLDLQIKGLPDLQSRLADTQEKRKVINSEFNEALKSASELKGRILSVTAELERMRKDEETFAGQFAKLEKLKGAQLSLEKLRMCFDREGIQKTIRKDSAVFITNMMREHSFSFNLNFDDVRVSEDMSIEVSQNNQSESIDMLSGGERTALAIALRLAIVKYVNESIKTMVMDEPTVFLDEDRRQNLTDILQYTFNGEENPIPQMIIVSHHSELRSVSNNVFEVKKSGGTSTVIMED